MMKDCAYVDIKHVTHQQCYLYRHISYSVLSQNKEGILPVATLAIAIYVSSKSRSESNVAPEVTKLPSPL